MSNYYEEKRMLTGVYVNPELRIAKEMTIEDDLHTFYELLNCDLIDITPRTVKVGDKEIPVSIICDDEGLLHADPIVSAFDSDGRPALVGNLFVVSGDTDDEGNNISLAPDAIKDVLSTVCEYFVQKSKAVYKGLYGVDYAVPASFWS